jgi:hypothetical protein
MGHRRQRRLLHHPRRGRAGLSYVYYENDLARRAAAGLLTRDEARRIALNVAKFPELVKRLSIRRTAGADRREMNGAPRRVSWGSTSYTRPQEGARSPMASKQETGRTRAVALIANEKPRSSGPGLSHHHTWEVEVCIQPNAQSASTSRSADLLCGVPTASLFLFCSDDTVANDRPPIHSPMGHRRQRRLLHHPRRGRAGVVIHLL